MISGALVTTANSSGGSWVRPAAERMLWQPAAENAPPAIAAATRIRRTRLSLSIACSWAFSAHAGRLWPQQRIIQQSGHADRDRAVRDVEHIPIVAADVKVKKSGNFAVDQPVDQVPDGAADHETETHGQGRTVGVP